MRKPSVMAGLCDPSRGKNLNGLDGLPVNFNRRINCVNVHYSINFSGLNESKSGEALMALMTAF